MIHNYFPSLYLPFYITSWFIFPLSPYITWFKFPLSPYITWFIFSLSPYITWFIFPLSPYITWFVFPLSPYITWFIFPLSPYITWFIFSFLLSPFLYYIMIHTPYPNSPFYITSSHNPHFILHYDIPTSPIPLFILYYIMIHLPSPNSPFYIALRFISFPPTIPHYNTSRLISFCLSRFCIT